MSAGYTGTVAVDHISTRVSTTTYLEEERDLHAKHDTQSPAPTDGLVVSMRTVTEDDLGDDTIAEHDQDEGTQEFREWFSKHSTYPRPS